MTTSPDPEQTRAEYLIDAIRGTSFDAGLGAQEAVDPSWLVDGMIVQGALLMLAGPPKVAGKSLLTIDLCYCVASGKPFLGRPVRRGRSFLMNLEDGGPRLKWRLRDFGIRSDATCPPGSFTVMPDKKRLADWLEFFADYSDEQPSLIVIDPTIYAETVMGCTNENDPGQVTAFCDKLRDITNQGKTSIVLVHHFRKAGDVLRGSSAWEASVDGWFNFLPGENDLRYLNWFLRDAEPGEAGVALKYAKGSISVMGVDPALARPIKGKREEDDDGQSTRDIKVKVWQLLLQAKRDGDTVGMLTTDIQRRLKIRRSKAIEVLQELAEEGVIERISERRGWRAAVDGSDAIVKVSRDLGIE